MPSASFTSQTSSTSSGFPSSPASIESRSPITALTSAPERSFPDEVLPAVYAAIRP